MVMDIDPQTNSAPLRRLGMIWLQLRSTTRGLDPFVSTAVAKLRVMQTVNLAKSLCVKDQ